MSEHPIQGLMKTAMESLKTMIDVNTVIGDPVEAQDGTVIIPVSRVSFGFAAGGGEYSAQPGGRDESGGGQFPFGGGSGAGVSVRPVGFLVVGNDRVRMLPVDGAQPLDRLMDLAPELLDRLRGGVAGGRKKTGHAASATGTTGAEPPDPDKPPTTIR